VFPSEAHPVVFDPSMYQAGTVNAEDTIAIAIEGFGFV